MYTQIIGPLLQGHLNYGPPIYRNSRMILSDPIAMLGIWGHNIGNYIGASPVAKNMPAARATLTAHPSPASESRVLVSTSSWT